MDVQGELKWACLSVGRRVELKCIHLRRWVCYFEPTCKLFCRCFGIWLICWKAFLPVTQCLRMCTWQMQAVPSSVSTACLMSFACCKFPNGQMFMPGAAAQLHSVHSVRRATETLLLFSFCLFTDFLQTN